MNTAVLRRRPSKKPVRLSGISETLLIPLWARAVETLRPDAILRDPIAWEIFARIDYDFSKFERAWTTQTGIAIRTKLLDEAASAFIAANPEGIIINLGAGLSTRFSRIDDGSVHWYEVDLPDVIALRKRFFRESGRYRCIAGSVMEPATLERIIAGSRPVMVLAEGLFMYFPEEDIRSLFERLSRRSPKAQMLLEILAPFSLGMGKYDPCVSKVAGGMLEFRWAVSDCRAMERWGCGLRVLREWNVLNHHRERWGWLGWLNLLAPHALPALGNRIVHLRFV